MNIYKSFVDDLPDSQGPLKTKQKSKSDATSYPELGDHFIIYSTEKQIG